MISSWKRPAFNAIFAAALAAAAFLAVPRPAAAAGCPTTPVAEHGGSHWCYQHDGTKGNVHLWTSPGYKADTAITVVFIHGLDTGKNGPDTCHGKRPYVDCIWDAPDHGIVSQFAASGVNALFVAVEGQILSARTEPVRWASVGSLLGSIAEKGKITAPSAVTVAGHSAGMYTAKALSEDARVKHLISLDWVDGSLEGQVSGWYKRGAGRKLTLVGGSSGVDGKGGQQAIMDRMAKDLPCTLAQSPTGLASAELALPCLYMKTSTSHMRVVFDKKFLPQAIKRSESVAAAGGGSAPAGGSGGTTSAGPLADASIDAPVLEIPIPGLELSAAVRANGQVTIPWLAQYIGGVYTFLLSIVGVLAAVMMVVGGFEYLTSGGDKGRIGKGREKIMNALTGLVLALSSYVILYVINPNLVAFDGLKVGAVQTQLYESEERAHDEGDVYQESAVTPGAPGPGAGGLPGKVCKSEGECRPYCKDANCIATLGQDGKARVTCDSSKFPQSAPGIIDASQAVNAKQAFSGQVGISAAQAGDKVSTTVRDGLIRAGKIADREGYAIVMTDGFRTLPEQFELVCTRIIKADYWRATKPDVAKALVDGIGIAVAWPGSSLHGAGFAADIQLNKKGGSQVVCSGCCDVEGQDQYKDPSKLFDKIMTEAGARRYSNEIWHYEFGAPASVQPRCTYPDCPWPPSCKAKKAAG